MSGAIDPNYMIKILQVVQELQSQMNGMKEEMTVQHQKQIERLEQLHEKDKKIIEEMHKDECDGYKNNLEQKDVIILNLQSSLQTINTKVQNLEINIIEKDKKNNDLEHDLNQIKIENGNILSDLQTKNAKIQNLEQCNIKNDKKIEDLKNDLKKKGSNNFIFAIQSQY